LTCVVGTPTDSNIVKVGGPRGKWRHEVKSTRHTQFNFELADGNILSTWMHQPRRLTITNQQPPVNDSCVQMDLIDRQSRGQQNVRLWFDHDRNLYKCQFQSIDNGQPATACDSLDQKSVRRSITNLRDFQLQTTQELHDKCRELTGEKRTGRSRRQKRSNPFIMPGTRWCGRGNAATREQMFGDEIEVDMCCFEHDSCSENIPSLARKYGHYNTSPVTLSLCECDDRFLECLENAGTYAANRVGNIYFNLFKIPCFRRVNRTVCAEKSDRTGECIRRVTRSTIELYQSQTYTSVYEL
uniref:PA2c domain-containing protein n=1 Tax=Echinostoma caproni TaxID=27848 RepID=A0A183ATP6_9TREM